MRHYVHERKGMSRIKRKKNALLCHFSKESGFEKVASPHFIPHNPSYSLKGIALKTRIAVVMEDIERQIDIVLDKIRPFLQREGGDVELIGFKDGVVYLRMVGACEGCAYVDQDISSGVEVILMEEIPGVIRCDASMNVPKDVMDRYIERKQKEGKDGK